MEWLAGHMALTPAAAAFVMAAVFLAGLARGFSGFALSALVLASVTSILPPVEMVPVCIVLEATASLALGRAAIGLADRRIVAGLLAGVVAGLPLGAFLTTTLPAQQSSLIALGLILTLSVLLLTGLRLSVFETRMGPAGVGVLAGLANGLASVGGLVVALFALAGSATPAVIRATIVVYVIGAITLSAIAFAALGALTEVALIRGLILAPAALAGVLIGARLFTPRFAPYYRPVCLCLLALLSLIGLAQRALS